MHVSVSGFHGNPKKLGKENGNLPPSGDEMKPSQSVLLLSW